MAADQPRHSFLALAHRLENRGLKLAGQLWPSPDRRLGLAAEALASYGHMARQGSLRWLATSGAGGEPRPPG